MSTTIQGCLTRWKSFWNPLDIPPVALVRPAACSITDYRIWTCIITDIGMPGINGFELRDRVKSACPELPVFLTTGRHEIADQGGAQGVNGFFRKPFDAPDLLVAVCKALRKSRDRG
ncbi:FixJ family two-component response regulator [Sinorhizobium meliloti]